MFDIMEDLKENIQKKNMEKLVLSAALGMFCYCSNNASSQPPTKLPIEIKEINNNNTTNEENINKNTEEPIKKKQDEECCPCCCCCEKTKPVEKEGGKNNKRDKKPQTEIVEVI